MEKEIWKPISGYEESYEVSDLGRVKSLMRITVNKSNPNRLYHIEERILQLVNRSGPTSYFCVCLQKNGLTKQFNVHRIVAEAFLPDWDPNLQVNHLNGNKQDNRISNLEMCTQSGNMKHAYDNKLTTNYGESHYRSVLTKEQVVQIRLLYHFWDLTQQQIAKSFSINQKTVWEIVNNKTYIR